MKEKLGLVLEGGAMRGMFTAGVIDVMLEKNMRRGVRVQPKVKAEGQGAAL